MAGGFKDWSDVVARLRALGGAADNVVLGYENGRRGLRVIDPSRSFRIFIPRSLFVACNDIEPTADTLSIKTASYPEEVAAFFSDYHRMTSWSGGRAEVEEFLREMNALPTSLRELLAEDFGDGDISSDPDEHCVLKHFLESRLFSVDGTRCFVPVLDLLNHDEDSPPFSAHPGGVLVEGKAKSEVLVRYSQVDSWQKFVQYGFVSRERYAFSRGFNARVGHDGMVVNILNDFGKRKALPNGRFSPIVTSESGAISISFVLLGDRRDATHAVEIFHEYVEPHLGKDSGQVLATIRNINRIKFLRIIGACGALGGGLVEMIRSAAQLQLESMSFCSA